MEHRGFVIEGRVKWKSVIREYKRGTDEGRLFTFIMYDKTSDISLLAANENCDKWFAAIEVGQCYRISRLTPKPANPEFNRTAHDCELQITKVSVLTFFRECRNGQPTIDLTNCILLPCR